MRTIYGDDEEMLDVVCMWHNAPLDIVIKITIIVTLMIMLLNI